MTIRGQHEGEFVALQGAVVVGEADAAIELRIAGQALFHARHADEDDADAGAVEHVSDAFERGHRQTLGLVKDQHFDQGLTLDDPAALHVTMEVLIDAQLHPHDVVGEGGTQVA